MSHCLGGFCLGGGGDMGVGIEDEACGEVAQHPGDGFDIHTILEGEGSEGVAEVMEANLRDACSFEHSFQHIIDAVRRDGAAVGRGNTYWSLVFAFWAFGTSIACGEIVTMR